MFIKDTIKKISFFIALTFSVMLHPMFLLKTHDKSEDHAIPTPRHLLPKLRFLGYALSTLYDEESGEGVDTSISEDEFGPFFSLAGCFTVPEGITERDLVDVCLMVRHVESLKDLHSILDRKDDDCRVLGFKTAKLAVSESIHRFKLKCEEIVSNIDDFVSHIKTFELLDLPSEYFQKLLDTFVERYKELDLETFFRIPQRSRLKIAVKYLLRYGRPIKITGLLPYLRDKIDIMRPMHAMLSGYYKSTCFCDTSRRPKADIILPDFGEPAGVFARDITISYLIKNGYLEDDFSMERVDITKIKKAFWQLPNIKVKNQILHGLKRRRYIEQV